MHPQALADAYPPLALHIGGAWLHTASGGQREVHDPATGALLGQLPLAGSTELNAAADAAALGFERWRHTLPLQRCDILRRGAALMRERAPAMARVLTLEQGKPLAEAEREVRLSADIIDVQAEEARRVYGHTVPPRLPGILMHEVRHRPLGPVAALTAWNFPVNLPARKLGAALAAGCSVVLKPAEETPGSAVLLVQCLLDAGLPDDVLSLVFGDPAHVSRTLIDRVASSRQAILSADAVTDTRFRANESVMVGCIRSVMCVPVTSGDGRLLGVIQVDSRDIRDGFDAEDLDVLASQDVLRDE
jgi:succinate-semialdehyde dehydrogenase/glutarate-semialdehyde dehydrogenase